MSWKLSPKDLCVKVLALASWLWRNSRNFKKQGLVEGKSVFVGKAECTQRELWDWFLYTPSPYLPALPRKHLVLECAPPNPTMYCLTKGSKAIGPSNKWFKHLTLQVKMCLSSLLEKDAPIFMCEIKASHLTSVRITCRNHSAHIIK